MKLKASKRYEVSFDDEEVIEALIHWLARVRSRSDTIKVGCLLHNSSPKLSRRGKNIILRFECDDEDIEI